MIISEHKVYLKETETYPDCCPALRRWIRISHEITAGLIPNYVQ